MKVSNDKKRYDWALNIILEIQKTIKNLHNILF